MKRLIYIMIGILFIISITATAYSQRTIIDLTVENNQLKDQVILQELTNEDLNSEIDKLEEKSLLQQDKVDYLIKKIETLEEKNKSTN